MVTATPVMIREVLDSPLGRLIVLSREGSVCAVELQEFEGRLKRNLRRDWGNVHLEPAGKESDAVRRIRDYFAGDIGAIESIQVRTRGTAFQRQVWEALRRIPAGSTSTYGEVALGIGRPGRARAVGQANARNPVAIVQPCHRVVAAGGALGGYGWGLERKRWLLEHERVHADRRLVNTP